ncbi:hypothetical protein [Demequina sp. NBRC 110053]|uniref:hypothetical protein n=1 Tax=Demequina sp. NBRC 110053 TaxID=1570342 RepID=UPI000A01D539|nr:hypothetical protein [Demequina sp. NBRC 110053]
MTEARPKPLVGALLGALLGLIVMALLWIIGVLPPDRLPLFAIVAVLVFAVSWLLTQRPALARGRFTTVIVIAAMLGGVALTGIPEILRGGSLTQACTLEGTSSLETEPVSVAQTTAIDPFEATATDTIAWSGSVGIESPEATVDVSLLVGGFEIPLDSATLTNGAGATEWSGSVEVAPVIDAGALLLTGTYHVAATLYGPDGQCGGDGYLRVAPDSAFSGLLLALLWALLVVVLIVIVMLAVGVRRSIKESDRALAMVGTSAVAGETSTTVAREPDGNVQQRGAPGSPGGQTAPAATAGADASAGPAAAAGAATGTAAGARDDSANEPAGSEASAARPYEPETRAEPVAAQGTTSPWAEPSGTTEPAVPSESDSPSQPGFAPAPAGEARADDGPSDAGLSESEASDAAPVPEEPPAGDHAVDSGDAEPGLDTLAGPERGADEPHVDAASFAEPTVEESSVEESNPEESNPEESNPEESNPEQARAEQPREDEPAFDANGREASEAHTNGGPDSSGADLDDTAPGAERSATDDELPRRDDPGRGDAV